jgi:hypothetical protein
MATPAPQTADSAPRPAAGAVFEGLAEALNSFQRRLVQEGFYRYADVYTITFAPSILGSATVRSPGSVQDNRFVPMANPNQAIRPQAQAVDTNSSTINAHAGMQIIQLIDQIMRNSSYITDQTRYNYDDLTDETQAGKPSKATVWYKINFTSTPRGNEYDDKRNDYAYNINYTITPWAVVDMQSSYFPPGRYRGVHKAYNYWFTGLNKEIISYEQDYNTLWNVVISGSKIPTQQSRSNGYVLQNRIYQSFSGETSQGREGHTNEPQSNAANYLFNPGDQSSVKIKIIGDPAWLQQGEAAGNLNINQFETSPFNADGAINFEASEICFRVNWNAPSDYDLATGLMAPLGGQSGDYKGATQTVPNPYDIDLINAGVPKPKQADSSVVYKAKTIRSTFSRGVFTQELEGVLFQEPLDAVASQNSREILTPTVGGAATTLVTQATGQAAQTVAANQITQGFLAGNQLITSGIQQGVGALLPVEMRSIAGEGVQAVQNLIAPILPDRLSDLPNQIIEVVRDF